MGDLNVSHPSMTPPTDPSVGSVGAQVSQGATDLSSVNTQALSKLTQSTLKSLKDIDKGASTNAALTADQVGTPANPKMPQGHPAAGTKSLSASGSESPPISPSANPPRVEVAAQLASTIVRDIQENIAQNEKGLGAPQQRGSVAAWLMGSPQTAFSVAIALVGNLQKELTASNSQLSIKDRDMAHSAMEGKRDAQLAEGEANKQMLKDQATAAFAFAAVQLGMSVVSFAASAYSSTQRQEPVTGADGKPQYTMNGPDGKPVMDGGDPPKPLIVDKSPNATMLMKGSVDKEGNAIYNTNYSGAIDGLASSVGGFGQAYDKLIQANKQDTLASLKATQTVLDDLYQALSKSQDKAIQNAQKAQDLYTQLYDAKDSWISKLSQLHASGQG